MLLPIKIIYEYLYTNIYIWICYKLEHSYQQWAGLGLEWNQFCRHHFDSNPIGRSPLISQTSQSSPMRVSYRVSFVSSNSDVYLTMKIAVLWPVGHFKNAYELLNLRALKISMLCKNHIFECLGKIFCVEFQRVHLKFHTKYITHTRKDVGFIHRWKFKSS